MFYGLQYFDRRVINLMDKISSQLPLLEKDIKHYLQENNFDQATQLIQSLAETLEEPRSQLYGYLCKITELQSNFIEITKAVYGST